MKVKLFSLLIILFGIHFNCAAQISGATYCGPYTQSQPISISGQSNMTISGLEISNPNGDAISLSNCHNITIERCLLTTNSTGLAILLYNCTNITITDNRWENVSSGVYAQLCQQIKVTYNDSKNVVGPFPRGQMVQFNEVNGSGNQINFNASECLPGLSNPEDHISLYKTNGTANDPIQVIGNWIRGGGPSTSGSGIMTGDNNGSYVLVQDNILVNPGQVGIGVAGGHHIQVLDNKIFGAQNSISNVGLFVWNWTGNPPGTVCHSHTVSGNEVHWTNSDGNLNPSWDSETCGTVTGWSNNTWGAPIDASILPTQILTTCSPNVNLDISIFLESTYDVNTGLMSINLESLGLIPTNQPFNLPPWNYSGNETKTINDVTDWVLVSVRTGINPNTEIARVAGLIQTNGKIHFPDPTNLIANLNAPVYIVVQSRNHLIVMSAQLIDLVNNSLTFDFGLLDSYSGQGSTGQKQLSNGKWVMFAGDINQDKDISGADKSIWSIFNGSFGIYSNSDINLDGDVNGDDRIRWGLNNGVFSNVPQ